MVSKKAIIAIVAVVIVVAVVALAVGGGSSDKAADARYDYSVTLSDSIPDDLIDRPDEGMQYAIIDFVIANDHEDDGISTNFMYCKWTVTVDGVTYSDNGWLSVSHPDYQLVTVQVGAMAHSGAVIEVPADATLDDIVVSFEYDDILPPSFERDDSLL